MADYSQKESDRLKLGVRFMALAPRIITNTELGKYSVSGCSRYLGIAAADFIQGMASPPTSSDVATAAIEFGNECRSLSEETVGHGACRELPGRAGSTALDREVARCSGCNTIVGFKQLGRGV
jgi:hypothetical protein